MPRIPYSLAGGEVPGRIPLMSAPNPGVWALPGRAIGELGNVVQGAEESFQEAERRLQTSRDTVYASQVLSALDIFLDDKRQKYGTNISGSEAARDTREQGSQFLEDALRGTSDERVRNFIKSEASGRIARAGIVTREHVDKEVARETDRQAREQIRELSRAGTEESLDKALGLASGLAESGLWAGATAEAIRSSAIKESITNSAARGISADPRTELTKIDMRFGVYKYADETDIAQFRAAATSQINHVIAQEEKEQKKREAAVEEERRAQVDELDSRAAAGTLTLEEVERNRALRVLKGEDYRRIRQAVISPKVAPSDPDLLALYGLDAESANPKHKPSDIDRLYYAFQNGQPGLNYKDAADIKSKLRQRYETQRQQAESQQQRTETDLGRFQSQAEQTLRAGLGMSGLLEKYTQNQQRAFYFALKEVNERSAYFGGKENPLTVVQEILPRYQQLIRADVDFAMGQKRKLLLFDDPGKSIEENIKALEQRRKSGAITQGQYERDKQLWLEIDRQARDAMKGSNAEVSAPGLQGNTRGTK